MTEDNTKRIADKYIGRDGSVPEKASYDPTTGQRRYSLAEIDEMRALVRRRIEDASSGSYYEKERAAAVEDQLRTLMAAGAGVDELREERRLRDEAAREKQDKVWSRAQELAGKCPKCGAKKKNSGVTFGGRAYTDMYYECGGRASVLQDPYPGEAELVGVTCGKDKPAAAPAPPSNDNRGMLSALWPKASAKAWEHGFETKYVRATRYTSPAMGLNIGFTLPKHPHDCDRADMIDWLRSKGVKVFQCGGHPGAEILAKVNGIQSVEIANDWLQAFLPEFDSWIRTNLR